MRIRKVVQWVFGIPTFVLFALCALAFGMLLLMWVFPNVGAMAMVDAIALIVLAKRLSLIVPLFLISFWIWVAVTEFRIKTKVILYVVTIAPIAILGFHGRSTRCLNSEYFLDASLDPTTSTVYFISEREILIDDRQPFNPEPMRCDLTLEKVNLDGTGRTTVMQLQTNKIWTVDVFFVGSRTVFLAPATVRLHLSPTGRNAVLEILRGRSYAVGTTDRVYAIDLVRRLITPIESPQETEPANYTFESWSPTGDQILVRKRTEWTRPNQLGSFYINTLSNQLLVCDLNGNDTKPLTNQFPTSQQKGVPRAVVVADMLKGLGLVEPGTQRTNVLLQPILDRRSRIKDKRAYAAHLESTREGAKAYQEYQRNVDKQFQDHANAQRRAGALAESLNRHDTNALATAKTYLWEDHDLCCETFRALMNAKWDAADELANDFLLHGPKEGGCKAWAVLVFSSDSDRLSNSILRISADYSHDNLSVIESAVRAAGHMQNPEADVFLADVAVKCPDDAIRNDALNWLKARNRTLYSETMLRLANDKDFLAKYPRR